MREEFSYQPAVPKELNILPEGMNEIIEQWISQYRSVIE